MSKHQKRRRAKRSFPWPLVAFGGILLIVSAVLFARSPKAAPAAPVAGGTAGGRIAVDQPKVDYGYVKFGNNKSIRIKVTNTGGSALSFTEQPYIEVLEGC